MQTPALVLGLCVVGLLMAPMFSAGAPPLLGTGSTHGDASVHSSLGLQTVGLPAGAPTTLVATINLTKPGGNLNPYDIVYDSVNGIVYMSTVTSNLTEIQAVSMKLLPPADIHAPSVGLALDSANGFLYVTGSFSENATTVVNTATNRVVATIPTFVRPWGIAYDANNQFLYVADLLSNNVSVINGSSNTIVDSIPVGTYPMQVAFDSVNGDIYVTNTGSSNVSVISGETNRVVATIPITNGQAIGVTADAQTGAVYVSSNCPNGVTVINGSTNIATTFIATGEPFFGVGCQGAQNADGSSVAISNEFHLLYVTDSFSGTVSILNETNQSLATTVQVGQYPVRMALDTTDSLLYVSKYGATNLSVLGPAPVTHASPGASSMTFLGLSATDWFSVWLATLIVGVVGIVVLRVRQNHARSDPSRPPR